MADTDAARIRDVRDGFEAVAADALLRLKADDLMGTLAAPGSDLVGFSAGAPGQVLRTLMDKGRDMLTIYDFGAAGDGITDDTDAFRAAAERGGLILMPTGHFRTDFFETAAVADGAFANKPLWLCGWGLPIMSPYTPTVRGTFGCASANAGSTIDDLMVTGIEFRGSISTLGHYEPAALLYFTGVRRLLVAQNRFKGARGDGLTIGRGFGGGPAYERHNYDVVITRNYFDGELYGVTGGRNPISVIDCDGLIIEGNTCTRHGRSDMPGGIDLEPDETTDIIKNAYIGGNRMTLSGGNRGHITIAVDKTPHANCENIVIANNPQLDDAANAAICIYTNQTATTHAHRFQINDNQSKGCALILEKPLGHVNDMTFARNQVHDTVAGKGRFNIGDDTDRWTIRDLKILDNHLQAGATSIGAGVQDNLERADIRGNTFAGSTQAAFRLGRGSGGGYGATTYNHVAFEGNTVRGSPTNGYVQGDGSTDPATNTFLNNRAPDNKSLLHSMRALRNDNTGVVGNQRRMSDLPSTYPVGLSVIKIVSDNGITGDDNGTMFVYNMTGVLNQIHCEFWPVSTGTTDGGYHVRKATTAGTGWNDWVTK